MLFAEGTRALLDAGAQLSSVEQTAESISLRQSAGLVQYEVNPERHQRFQVAARGVLIEVIGTKFDVTVADEAVLVQVHRGIVTVHDGSRDVQLRRGEELRVVLGKSSSDSSESVQAMNAQSDAHPQEVSTGPSKPPVANKTRPVDVVGNLLKRADEARQTGDLATAETTLARLSAEYGSDPRAISILFSLGRVQNARGKYSQAAATFAQVRGRTSQGLGEDALAEEAVCLSLSGQGAASRARAQQYLSAYPHGLHRDRMTMLVP